ncbi:MAG: hypothetical protein JSW61_11915 [Candidatus Thorarchaeota archaeon]|nr:MAG: hypothetical protein JSW61_11915 [Candidatus Thorarchaeota archaeon]
MSEFVNSKAYPWALTGIFAAVHLVLSIIPAFPGVGGGAITLGMISGPLVGYLLGPIFGTFSVLIGSVMGLWVNPTVPLLGPFTIIPPTFGAFVAGFIREKKPYVATIMIGYSIALFYLGPLGQFAVAYLWLHIVAALLALILVIPLLSDSFDFGPGEKSPANLALLFFSIWIMSFVAVMTDHAIGSAIGVSYFRYIAGWPAADVEFVFMSIVLFIYPIERLVMSIILAIALFGLDRALVATEFRLPLIREGIPMFEELPEGSTESE